ncbi:12365_t:CDS:2 [Entrophospora sp. SA101]|nr:12365_t:CDS:2 [Entrophospora sp. SA101]
MFEYITQIFSYIGNALKSLNDSRDPFEAGDLYSRGQGKNQQIKDPVKITNIMLVNKTWYKEGKHQLYKDNRMVKD